MENIEVSRLHLCSVKNNPPTNDEINYIAFSKKDNVPWWGVCYLDKDNNFRIFIDNLGICSNYQEEDLIFPADYYIFIENEHPEDYWTLMEVLCENYNLKGEM